MTYRGQKPKQTFFVLIIKNKIYETNENQNQRLTLAELLTGTF